MAHLALTDNDLLIASCGNCLGWAIKLINEAIKIFWTTANVEQIEFNLNCVSVKYWQLVRSVSVIDGFLLHSSLHNNTTQHANEAFISTPAADSGLHRARAERALLLGANVHQPEIAVNNAARPRLSHALQHYSFEWMHHHDQGELEVLLSDKIPACWLLVRICRNAMLKIAADWSLNEHPHNKSREFISSLNREKRKRKLNDEVRNPVNKYKFCMCVACDRVNKCVTLYRPSASQNDGWIGSIRIIEQRNESFSAIATYGANNCEYFWLHN